MHIYFIRHGETNANKEKIIQGQRIDESLNEIGVHQVKDILPDLPSPIDAIFSSPLLRAKQSAEIIAEHIGVDIIFRDELMERDFGDLSGKNKNNIGLFKKGTDEMSISKFIDFPFEDIGGEALKDFDTRVSSFIDFTKENYQDKILLATTHGGVIRALHRLFSEDEIKEDHHASIHEFEF